DGDMYHIFAAERQRQYGARRRQNHPPAAASFLVAADPPGLVQLAPALLAGVGGVDQQRDVAAPRRALDLLGAEHEMAGARLQPEPVERSLGERRLDPCAEIGRNRDAAGPERTRACRLEPAPGQRRLERGAIDADPRAASGRAGTNVRGDLAVRRER